MVHSDKKAYGRDMFTLVAKKDSRIINKTVTSFDYLFIRIDNI